MMLLHLILPGNDDLLYTLLLFDEQMTWIDSANKISHGGTADIEVNSTNKHKLLQDVLLDLSGSLPKSGSFIFMSENKFL